MTHDRRFDGVFYVGVSSTGVYCRTVCTARTPHKKNCKFYLSAAAAECAGFRPCLRCRPELAPGNASVDAVSNLAASIAERIECGNFVGVQELATELGISDRHLRRVVQSEFGVSPIDLAQTHRLLLAKLLLCDSQLAITEIAFASGFASVRQFNSVFKERYNLKPSDLRKNKSKLERPLKCEIAYRKPFSWDKILGYLAARAVPAVEMVTSDFYARTLRIEKFSGWIKVSRMKDRDTLDVEVSSGLAAVLPAVLFKVRKLFDLNANTQTIEEKLGTLVIAKNSGLRVPGTCDEFELALRAILNQQISVKAASTFMGRIANKFGEEIETPFAELSRLTPECGTIAEADLTELTSLGIVPARAQTLINLSLAITSGEVDLKSSGHPALQITRLKDIAGIGEWTAQYIAMRALKWPDAFPHTDLGIRKAVGEANPRKILELAEKWQPWRAYAVMHLWSSLAEH